MEQQHTPEPWSRNISAKYPIYHEWVLPDGRRNNRKIAAVLGNDEQAEADLRRIVACVNACAGIPTEALEGGALAGLFDDPSDALNFKDPDRIEVLRAILAKLGGGG